MYINSTEEIYVEPAQADIAVFLTLYVLVSIIGIIGNVSLMAALASSGASRLRTPQLLSACAADLLVCAASAPLAATSSARIQQLPCHVSYYIESLPVAASTFSLVAIAADRCCAVRRGRSSLCSRPGGHLSVGRSFITWCHYCHSDLFIMAATGSSACGRRLLCARSGSHSMSLDGLSQNHCFIIDGTCGSWGVAPTSSSYASPNSRYYSSWSWRKRTPRCCRRRRR